MPNLSDRRGVMPGRLSKSRLRLTPNGSEPQAVAQNV